MSGISDVWDHQPETEQPLPKPGGESVTDRLIERLLERQKKGIATYGRSLETFNGRDAIRDLEEELLDGLQYLTQVRLEREALEAKIEADWNKLLDRATHVARAEVLAAAVLKHVNHLDKEVSGDDGCLAGLGDELREALETYQGKQK